MNQNKKYLVGLPDTQGNLCWLAGYESDPTRYYTKSCALVFDTKEDAENGSFGFTSSPLAYLNVAS